MFFTKATCIALVSLSELTYNPPAGIPNGCGDAKVYMQGFQSNVIRLHLFEPGHLHRVIGSLELCGG